MCRISLDESLDWRKCQLEDPVLCFFLEKKEVRNRPSWREVSFKDTSIKIYRSQWDASGRK